MIQPKPLSFHAGCPTTYSWTQNGFNMRIDSDSFYYGGSPPEWNDDFVVTAVDLYGSSF
jgi:hypothetical protein